MRKVLVLLALAPMLLSAVPAFAGPVGVQVVVKNVGSEDAEATVLLKGMTESENPVTKAVAAKGSATFSKIDTAHDASERFPLGWEMDIGAPSISKCHYVISLSKKQCSLQSAVSSCADVTNCGECCYEFTIKPQ